MIADLIFNMLISPIVDFMEALMIGGIIISHGDLGFSIILMSILMNILILPMSYYAESLSNKEKIIQSEMSRVKDSINKNYTKVEKHYYLQTLYRLHNYKPIQAIKSSSGLLLQIPFFIAAYYLISNTDLISNESFYIIKNLSQPDQLLFGLNVLPIAMTLISLLSSYIYQKKQTKSELIQLWSLSLIFLIVLYNAPSALLIYWLMNNIFSLIKNSLEFLYKNYNHNIKNKKIILLYHMIMQRKYFYLALMIGLLGTVLFLYLVGFQKKDIDKFNLFEIHNQIYSAKMFWYALPFYLITIVSLATVIFNLFSKYMQRDKKNIAFVYWIVFSIITFVMSVLFGIISNAIVLYFCVSLLILNLILIFFATSKLVNNLISVLYRLAKPPSATVLSFNLILTSSLLIIYFINPILLYKDSPDFVISYIELLTGMFLQFLQILIIGNVIYFFAAEKFQKLYTLVLAFIFTLIFSYSFIIVPDFGLMDNFTLLEPHRIVYSNTFRVIEFVCLIIALVSIVYIFKKYLDKIRIFFIIFFILSLFFISFNAKANVDESLIKLKSAELIQGDENKKWFSFSKEKNILILFLDAYSGSAMQDYFDKKSKSKDEFKGFTWYKNILSEGTRTSLSLASMLAGESYDVRSTNKRNYNNYYEVFDEAYTIYLNTFLKNNWEITYYDAQYYLPKYKIKGVNYIERDHFKKKFHQKLYSGEKYSDNRPQFEISSLTNISVLRALPLSLKTFYHKLPHVTQKIPWNFNFWGFIDAFETNIQLGDDKPTFKFFQIGIPHGPNTILEDGTFDIKKGSYKISALKITDKVIELLKKLKRIGVYKNTKIILISDHGRFVHRNNPMFEEGFNKKVKKVNPWLVHPLLMVKDFNSSSELVEDSESFMSNADLPYFVCKEDKDFCGIKKYNPFDLINRKLTIHHGDKSKFGRKVEVKWSFEVTNNLFKANNWKLIN